MDLRRFSVFAVLVVICLTGIGRGLWTPDEPREAEIIREMALSPGMIPHLGGVPFLEKPPLYYWVSAAVFRITGSFTAVAARSVSTLFSLLTLLALYLWCRQAAGPRVALLAVMLLGTCAEFLISAHWIRMDPLLMFWCTLAFWGGWQLLAGRGGRWALVLTYSALVLALWTKGLVGPVTVLAGWAAYCASDWRRRRWRSLRPFIGALVLLGAALLLGWLIFVDGGMAALKVWAWDNHVLRFVHPQTTGHRQPVYYYLLTLPATLLPWLVPLAYVFGRSFWRGGSSKDAARYCAAVCAGGLVVLSAASTKREIYLLPILPVASMLLALAVENWGTRLSVAPRRTSRGLRGAAYAQIAFLVIWGLVPGAGLLVARAPGRAGSAVSILLVVGLGVAAWRNLASGRLEWAASAAFASVAVTALSLLLLVVPFLDEKKDFAPFITEMDALLPAGAPVPTLGADETIRGIVPFLTGRAVNEVTRPGLGDGIVEGGGGPPSFLLWQSRTQPESVPGTARYELILERTIGRKRHLMLWRRMDPGVGP